MAPTLSPKVFISHSTSGDPPSAAFLDQLRRRLREWEVDPWLDKDRLETGEIWNEQLRLAIQRCDAAILFVTKKYIREGDTYARDEALMFAQRAVTEPFDDFRLLVIVAPDVAPVELRNDRWANLEVDRWQVVKLASLEAPALDGLRPAVDSLLARYRSGAVPLVLREHYAEQIKSTSAAVLAQATIALELAVDEADATPRRFVNAVLGVTPELRRPLGVLPNCLRPWKTVLPEEVRTALAWDAVAFTWLDDDAARPIARAFQERGQPGRKVLVLASELTHPAERRDVAKLHLRRARDLVAPVDETQANANETTREGLLRALCIEIAARRRPRQRRVLDTLRDDELDAFARELDAMIGNASPLVILLDRDVCQPDMLDGLPELLSNVVLVALGGEDSPDLGSMAVIVRTPDAAILDTLEDALL